MYIYIYTYMFKLKMSSDNINAIKASSQGLNETFIFIQQNTV